MQIVRYADAELKTRGINHRVGTFKYKELGEGRSGTAGNFNLRMVWSETDFYSPRHMHNFDQVRVQIAGTFRFDKDGTMKPGVVAYFPEGTPYGPQTSQQDTATLVMQIGGASGNGYLSEAERVAAVDQLAGLGHFDNGRFFPQGDEKSIDGFQAAWELALGRKMKYPPQRFQKPVFINSGAIGWGALRSQTAVEHRRLWDFGQRTVGLDQYQAAAGEQLDLAGPVSCFVEAGAGQVGSQPVPETPTTSGDAPVADRAFDAFDAFDTVHLATGECARFMPTSDTRLLVFVHPVF